MPDTVTQDEWDAARVVFYRILNAPDDQDLVIRAQMRAMIKNLNDNMMYQWKDVK